MVQHYAKLTKDVESREARALWRIKRHNLNEK
uniref:Uncharacterized protein n=1 Tax=Ciona savignyi TaxID=51511 RepID=H2Y948_CIOSA